MLKTFHFVLILFLFTKMLCPSMSIKNNFDCTGLTSNHNSVEHKFYPTKLQKHLLQRNREINILLSGETCVGKSTFINAFANYLTFKTFEDAEKNELIYLIFSQLTVIDENYKKVLVKIGQDVNESFECCHLTTISCKAYIFPYENYQIRLIDTWNW